MLARTDNIIKDGILILFHFFINVLELWAKFGEISGHFGCNFSLKGNLSWDWNFDSICMFRE